LLQLQIQREKELGVQQTQAIEAQSDNASLISAFSNMKTGNKFVDALSGTVRPVVTYTIISFYVLIKILLLIIYRDNLELSFIQAFIWTSFDMDLVAVIVGFWFSSRAFQKARL
jgi:uncharacterized integral membrane protein